MNAINKLTKGSLRCTTLRSFADDVSKIKFSTKWEPVFSKIEPITSGANLSMPLDLWFNGVDASYAYDGSRTGAFYKLEKDTLSFCPMDVNDPRGIYTLENFRYEMPNHAWSDGVNTYFSYVPFSDFDTADELLANQGQFVLKGDTWEPIEWKFSDSIANHYIDGKYIWSDGSHIYYSEFDPSIYGWNNEDAIANQRHFVLNGDTWEPKTWEGLDFLNPYYIITCGTCAYYRHLDVNTGSAVAFYLINNGVLESTTLDVPSRDNVQKIIQCKEWCYLIGPENLAVFADGALHSLMPVGDIPDGVWSYFTDGIYLYGQGDYQVYVLNLENMTWEQITLYYENFYNNQIRDINNLWTDGSNIYYSSGNEHYVLNGDTWETKEWKFHESITSPSVAGNEIWTDGTNIYYSRNSRQYILNGDTWEPKTWDLNSASNIKGYNIWSDGVNIYSSSGGGYQYILNGDTWNSIYWDEYASIYASQIWSDGNNVYHSNGSSSTHRVLKGNAWEEKTWNSNSSEYIYGEYIWSDGTNIYYRGRFKLNGDTWEPTSIAFPGEIYGTRYVGKDVYAINQSNYIYKLMRQPIYSKNITMIRDIEGTETELYPKTLSEQVFVDEFTTLDDKLPEIQSTLDSLGTLSTLDNVAEDNLTTELASKINAVDNTFSKVKIEKVIRPTADVFSPGNTITLRNDYTAEELDKLASEYGNDDIIDIFDENGNNVCVHVWSNGTGTILSVGCYVDDSDELLAVYAYGFTDSNGVKQLNWCKMDGDHEAIIESNLDPQSFTISESISHSYFAYGVDVALSLLAPTIGESIIDASDTDKTLSLKAGEGIDLSVDNNVLFIESKTIDGITAEKIAAWDAAQPNVIEKVTVGGTEVEIADKTVALGALAGKDQIGTADVTTVISTALTAGENSFKKLRGFDQENGSVKTYVDTADTALSDRLTALEGEDAGKSVRSIAAEELAAQLVAEGAQESLDTLAEIAAWIQEHPEDAAAMNEAIAAIEAQLKGIAAGEGTVKKYVDDSISGLNIGDYAKTADLSALLDRLVIVEEAISWGKISDLINS